MPGGCVHGAESPGLVQVHAAMTCGDMGAVGALLLQKRDIVWLLPGTPSMNSGVRNALGPGLRSFRRENSLQGGADHRAPRTPLDAVRSSKRYCVSSKMLKAASASRSKGCKQSACSASMAALMGALTPANRSRKSFGAVECLAIAERPGSSDELEEELEEERRRLAGGGAGGVFGRGCGAGVCIA